MRLPTLERIEQLSIAAVSTLNQGLGLDLSYADDRELMARIHADEYSYSTTIVAIVLKAQYDYLVRAILDSEAILAGYESDYQDLLHSTAFIHGKEFKAASDNIATQIAIVRDLKLQLAELVIEHSLNDRGL